MRRILFERALMAAAIAVLTACSPSVQAAPIATPSSAPVVEVGNSVTASVRVVPAQASDLGFLIAAPVKQVLVHEGDDVEAGQALVVLEASQLDLGVEAAEQGLLAAQRNEFIQGQGRRKWDGFKFVWVAGPPEQRTQAHARVLQAQAGLDAAKAELDQSILRAPFDGTVVAISVQTGEVVQVGQIVATVGDLAHLRIETTDLSERDIARVRVGQAAQVSLDAFTVPMSGVCRLDRSHRGSFSRWRRDVSGHDRSASSAAAFALGDDRQRGDPHRRLEVSGTARSTRSFIEATRSSPLNDVQHTSMIMRAA